MDRLDEWRLFVGVATRRSFSAAARAEGRSPQSATRAVAALEARLGARLFQRTTRAVSLTADGERALEQARRALAEMDRLEARDRSARGTVAITAPVLFGQLHVLPIVQELLAAHEGIDARLLLLDRVVSLAEEGIDAAVRIGELPDSALRARLVGHVREVLVASPSYLARAGRPRNVAALARHACIAFLGTTTAPDRWTFGQQRVVVRPRLVVSSPHAALDAARAGVGVVRLLSYQVAADLEAGRLVPLLGGHDSGPIPVHLVQLAGLTSRAVQLFADLAYGRLRDVLSRGA